MEKQKELLDEVAAREKANEEEYGEIAEQPGPTGSTGKPARRSNGSRQRRKVVQASEQEPAALESSQAPGQEQTALESSQAPGQEPVSPEGSTGATLYSIMTTCDVLNIRSGAGKEHSKVGTIREMDGNKKNHDIVEEKDGWGRLSSGEGWICLSYTRRVSW